MGGGGTCPKTNCFCPIELTCGTFAHYIGSTDMISLNPQSDPRKGALLLPF